MHLRQCHCQNLNYIIVYLILVTKKIPKLVIFNYFWLVILRLQNAVRDFATRSRKQSIPSEMRASRYIDPVTQYFNVGNNIHISKEQ